MSIKESKALIRRVYHLWNQKAIASTYELYAPECVFHTSGSDMSVQRVKDFDAKFLAAFPDAKYTIEEMIAEGNMVAYRVTIRATHQGEFIGIASTGKRVEFISTGFAKIVAGKCVEWWGTADMLSLMQQLGASLKR